MPRVVIVTASEPPGDTDDEANDRVALMAASSSTVTVESPPTCIPLNASKSASTPLKTPLNEFAPSALAAVTFTVYVKVVSCAKQAEGDILP